jgi:hypothetical protein
MDKTGLTHFHEYSNYQSPEGNVGLFITQRKKKKICFSLTSSTTAISEVIWECYWDGGKWLLVRTRQDKSFSNTVETVLQTLDSIKHQVSIDDII